MSGSSAKCPVDHESLAHGQEKCPVDSNSRLTWSSLLPKGHPPTASSSATGQPSLSTDRETSSIPKVTEGNWVYPSEAQFFAAMARKRHNPQAPDMKTIVPIHNAVNERAWAEVMKWESGRGGEQCGGVKLVTFKGKPTQMSLRARWKTLLGYSPPFDRHDWVVDRCGTRMRYIIDFYTGHSQGPASNNLSFFLDVRPAFDNWEGVKMRVERFWVKWVGKVSSDPLPHAKSPS